MASGVRLSGRSRGLEEGLQTYDVFMSHRGRDTKTGFVSFLYDGLKDAGLRPFLDCKSIDKGQSTWECIKHAIKTAPISLVIFSESYAQSEWCLKELHLMLKSPCVTVLPIFYKVRPQEVRRPESGKLRDGFERLAGRCTASDIEQWRADLMKASELMGWEQSDDSTRLEGDLVSEVVVKVVELANKSVPLDVGDYVIGVEEVAKEIIQTLEDRKKVSLLGLWGMGGIGKSTLARELYNQLSKRFAAGCYVEDVREKVAQGGVVKVQNCILRELFPREFVEVENKSRGKSILEKRLSKKQILLVLDDVWADTGMEYFLSRKMLREGSLCIVTSRDSGVIDKADVFVDDEKYIHNVRLLSSENSRRVFAGHAFGGMGRMRPGFERLVGGISEACGGVPLVLKVCGALLRRVESMEEWEEVLEKLRCGDIMDEKKIFDCLMISYGALPHNQKEMFLDIACALLGECVDVARRIWRCEGWYGSLGIRSLEEKALITVDGEGCLCMHDHLRDMGREIERERRRSGGVCRRLWMPELSRLLEENGALPSSLRSLDINWRQVGGIVCDLSHMKELRILRCDAIKMSSVPSNLCFLKCRSLEEDGLSAVVVNAFHTLSPRSKLVVLDMQHSQGRKSLPNMGAKMRTLEVLNLRDCYWLEELPHWIGVLQKLMIVNLEGTQLRELSDSFGELSKLEVLNLRSCTQLRKLPDSFGCLGKLKMLDLEWSGIRCLPESFGELSNLEVLNFSWCGELRRLPDSFGLLGKLTNLDLKVSGIGSLPESFGKLSNLEVLNLRSCNQLRKLPDSFGCLGKLKKLYLEESRIVCLPESVGGLSSLEVLKLMSCEHLRNLPDSFGRLGKLKNLDLGWSEIGSLPESFGELSSLEVLDLRSCDELWKLPYSFGRLRKLKYLSSEWSRIESLPASFWELSNLEVLDLQSVKIYWGAWERWSCIWKNLEKPELVSNLELLNMCGCIRLTRLPELFLRGGKLSILTTRARN